MNTPTASYVLLDMGSLRAEKNLRNLASLTSILHAARRSTIPLARKMPPTVVRL